ncbi:MAG TPA: hypothetical protein VLV78_08065 [Thermoanaerobaculia bacterium]|nr:hypothetical protein [Thermoanaerobaculia bacterium]
MRNSAVILALCFAAAVSAFAAETMTPDALLQRGVASYRAGRDADATADLDAAAKAMLSQEQMQTYVNTGRFPAIDKLETALVYLTLAQSKLGHEDQAREAVQRLLTAERIETRYAQLPLGSDAAEFEAVAARLVPGTKFARGGATPPAPATPAPIVVQAPPLAPTPAPIVVQAPPLAPTPAPQPAAPVAQAVPQPPAAVVQPSPAPAEDRERMIEEGIARERARIEREANERIAAERAAIQRAADERVAAAQREAEARIAAIQSQNRRSYITTLRQADDFAANRQVSRANDIYNAIAVAGDAPREIVAEAGVGLYRTGAFGDAAAVFRKLAPFVRGEEDLRYYNAVSLFETGRYAEARKELACALPFLEVTEDVSRYQTKIEQASAR